MAQAVVNTGKIPTTLAHGHGENTPPPTGQGATDTGKTRVLGTVAGLHGRGGRTGTASRSGFRGVELCADTGKTRVVLTVKSDGQVWVTVNRNGRRIVHRELCEAENGQKDGEK